MASTHKDLDVWKKSIELVTTIYKITSDFPEHEKFGLVSQMRRSSVSVPSNIAEGAARESNKEFKRFLFISLGSLSELETQLIVSVNIEYLKSIQELSNQIIEIRKMLIGLIKYLKSKETDH